MEKAIQAPKLINASESDLKAVLRYCMLIVGVRSQNLPNDEEKAVLLQFVAFNYAGHTLPEIKLAFDMAVSGKLDVDCRCFENFSCEYFSRIMNAYRNWARSEIKQIKHVELPTLPPSEPDWSEAWEDYKERAKKYGADKVVIISPIYDWLVENQLLNLTNEQKWHYFNNAKREWINEMIESPSPQTKITASMLKDPDWTNNPDLYVNVTEREKKLSVRELLKTYL